ncbi:MAG: undecaprenyl-diphosphatase, partial [Candidatus Omnitrophica bacterium]|nr:undecaprenyl-diphosphatase [Candidatus Omnitrophota bacterium]
MTIIQAVTSGIVQGITEFFPISSSGHLVLLHTVFGFKEEMLAFD